MPKNTYKIIGLSLICLAASLLNSCATHRPALNAHEWVYQPNAVTLNIKADPALNTIKQRSHALLVAVVQTTQLQKIQHYLQNSQGISSFLEKNNHAVDAQDFFINRYYVSPGEQHQLSITRMAGMKFVVVIAAYNHLIPNQTVKIFDVPVDSHVDGLQIWKRVYYPAPLHIDLHLGEQGILKAYAVSN
jgi:type VI secretion system VasD/TssJ family lipoprotein